MLYATFSGSTHMDTAKYLAKFGWEKGKGLGKHQQGITTFVRVSKREPLAGVGQKMDDFGICWNDVFNRAAQNIQIQVEADSSDSSDSDEEAVARTQHTQAARPAQTASCAISALGMFQKEAGWTPPTEKKTEVVAPDLPTGTHMYWGRVSGKLKRLQQQEKDLSTEKLKQAAYAREAEQANLQLYEDGMVRKNKKRGMGLGFAGSSKQAKQSKTATHAASYSSSASSFMSQFAPATCTSAAVQAVLVSASTVTASSRQDLVISASAVTASSASCLDNPPAKAGKKRKKNRPPSGEQARNDAKTEAVEKSRILCPSASPDSQPAASKRDSVHSEKKKKKKKKRQAESDALSGQDKGKSKQNGALPGDTTTAKRKKKERKSTSTSFLRSSFKSQLNEKRQPAPEEEDGRSLSSDRRGPEARRSLAAEITLPISLKFQGYKKRIKELCKPEYPLGSALHSRCTSQALQNANVSLEPVFRVQI
eukprot:g38750.t1